jgi:hypothetical protein
MRTASLCLALVAMVCPLGLAVPAFATQTVSGTSSAWVSTDPGFEGWNKYCFEIDWQDGHGLSHIDIFLGLEPCCVCTPGYFAFADTVGMSTGTTNGDTCTVWWHGAFNCDGDPTIPNGEPLVKFEYYENHCEPGTVVSAYLCFYSVAAPSQPGVFTDAIGVKFAGYTEKGDLVGVLPTCEDAISAAETSAWGKVKALFR